MRVDHAIVPPALKTATGAFILLLGLIGFHALSKRPLPLPEASDFVRYVEMDRQARLETAILRYRLPDGRTVDLIGAIHVADAPYYAALNERFRTYDSLLYELVGNPEDLHVESKKPALLMVHTLQKGMMNVLDLSFQLDGINYRAPNFVHADLTAEEFQQRLDARGESLFTFMLKTAQAQQAAEAGRSNTTISPWQLLKALFSKDRSTRLKLLLAKQFDEMETLLDAMDGGNEASVIIGERNARAMEVLQRELNAGKGHVGIFYGAGHLLDFERRLYQRGAKKIAHEWLTAWEIPILDGR